MQALSIIVTFMIGAAACLSIIAEVKFHGRKALAALRGEPLSDGEAA